MDKSKALYIKLGIAMLLGYITVFFLSKEVFVAATPKIKPQLGESLIAQLKDVSKGRLNFVAQLFDQRTPEQKLQNSPLQMLSKGVYAKSDSTTSYTVVKQGEVSWIEYTFNVNGKVIKIKVPQGQTPPSQTLVNKIYQ